MLEVRGLVSEVIDGVLAPGKKEVVVKTKVETEHVDRVIKRKTSEQPVKVMIRCPKCGRLNDPEAVYCKWCGARLKPESNEENK